MEALTMVILFGLMLKWCLLILGGLVLAVIIGAGLAFLVPIDRNITKHPNIPVADDTSEALEPGQVSLRR